MAETNLRSLSVKDVKDGIGEGLGGIGVTFIPQVCARVCIGDCERCRRWPNLRIDNLELRVDNLYTFCACGFLFYLGFVGIFG